MTNDFQIKDGILTIENVPYIKAQTFAARNDIVKVKVGQGVGFFEEETFAECENLEEVTLPEGIINVGVAAFTGCTNLKKINIPSSVKSIEDGAFLFCDALREIELPEGLESINELAFQSSGLEKITIPENCNVIGDEAFFECSNLVEANVLCPNADIGLNAFGSNYNLIKGYIAPGYPTDGDAVSDLLYSLLWASCPEKHNEKTSNRAINFIKNNEGLVMERILKCNNIPAMNGIASNQIFNPNNIDEYVMLASEQELTEITALLLKSKGKNRISEGAFEL